MFCFLPTRRVTFFKSQFRRKLAYFPKLYKPTPNYGLFSVQRNFLSGKIICFVQFVRMRVYYRLSTETQHHVSVQSEPFLSEVKEPTKYPPILTQMYKWHFEEN